MRYMPAVLALAVIAAAPALAQDLPTRKAGLWEMKMVFEGRSMPPMSMRQCIDAATDKAMQAQYGSGGAAGATCSKQDFRNAGGSMTFDSVCKIGASTTTTHGVITGSFDSAYTMKINSTREGGPPAPGMAATGESRMTIEAKHIGPCEAGQKPGDIMMGNGMKMNVKDMQRMGPGGMGAPGGGMPPPPR
jgi:Protein of unknown function (DUF3617)